MGFRLTGAWEAASAVCIFGLFGLLIFFTSPTKGDFSWSDAPRHGLNGIFVLDFIRALPVANPSQFSINYYLQYPALSILFYPPLFSLFLAGSYGVFGFSHPAAQGMVAIFHVLLAIAVYQLSRRWLSHWYAVAASLLLAGAPEIAFWGRQVMLDIPAYAWLAFMAVVFLRYLDTASPRHLYRSVFLLLACLYTKQTAIFVVVPVGITLLFERRQEIIRDRHLWKACLLFAILLVPLLLLQKCFGQVNSASALGSARADLPRISWAAWLYYAGELPRQLSWPTVALAVAYLAGCLFRPDWRLPRTDLVFLIAWLVSGYIFFSLISVREPRHDLMALLPLPIFSILAVKYLCRSFSPSLGQAAGLILSSAVLAWTIIFNPIPYVRGYDELARYVTARAPANSRVMFWGYRDGSFIFNMRAQHRPDLGIVRADKLFFAVSIERERGISDRGLSVAQIEALIRSHAIRYVVAQPGFWRDLPSAANLEKLLHDEARFKPVFRLETRSNEPITDRFLVVYQYLGEIAESPAPLSIDMVGIGRTFGER